MQDFLTSFSHEAYRSKYKHIIKSINKTKINLKRYEGLETFEINLQYQKIEYIVNLVCIKTTTTIKDYY